MEGPAIDLINIKLKDKNILDEMMEMNCVTWHPDFQKKYYSKIMDIIKNVPYKDLNNSNKWGYQINISRELKRIYYNSIDYTDRLIVKNKIRCLRQFKQLSLQSSLIFPLGAARHSGPADLRPYQKHSLRRSVDTVFLFRPFFASSLP